MMLQANASLTTSFNTCIQPSLTNNDLQEAAGHQFDISVTRRQHHDPSDLETDLLRQALKRKSRRMAPSRLLALPAELRNEIFEYALQETYPLGAGASYNLSTLAPKVFGGDAAKQGTQPPLLQVSRQVRRETLALFYQLNTFIMAVHYRRARAEVDRWIDFISTQPSVSMNLKNVTIKHRFGILDFRGTIDLDLEKFVIVGPKLWYNAIPPLTRKEVESIIDEAHTAERAHQTIVDTFRRLVDVLGVEPPAITP